MQLTRIELTLLNRGSGNQRLGPFPNLGLG